MYSSGRGVDENFEEAYICLSIAAKQNHPNAQCRLALMYINGNGVPESLSEAAHWANLAYEQGSEFAAEMMDEYELWDYIYIQKI